MPSHRNTNARRLHAHIRTYANPRTPAGAGRQTNRWTRAKQVSRPAGSINSTRPSTPVGPSASIGSGVPVGTKTSGRRPDRLGWLGQAREVDERERGAVVAELAIALPVLVALLMLGIWAIGLVVLNIQCIDAARDVARAVARGEPPDQAEAIGRRAIPTGSVTITREASDIQVTVTATPANKPPLLTFITPTRITATATLQAEPETS